MSALRLHRVLSRLALSAAAMFALAGAASAQTGSITLFGQKYKVQRFDYSTQIAVPNFAFPNDPPMTPFEAEGTHFLAGNKLLMTFDDISDSFPGNPDNWIIEVNVLGANECGVSGLSFSRTVARIDNAAYDPDPGGVTVNTGTTGVGAGGEIVVSGNEGFLYAFGYQATNFGQLLEYPVGSGCNPAVGACNLNVSATNINVEDVAFIPGSGARPDQLFLINQDLDGTDGSGIERRSTSGVILDTFLTGGGANPTITGAIAKGIAYTADSPKLPAAVRRPEGVVLVSYDRVFPALQVFDLDGNVLGTEILTVTGTAVGPFRLDMTGCLQRPHLESVAIDPQTGRIFLVNQGTFLTCNYMWVLTPACVADFDGVDCVTVADIFAYLNAWFANQPEADLDNNGIGVQDIFTFLNAWFAGC